MCKFVIIQNTLQHWCDSLSPAPPVVPDVILVLRGSSGMMRDQSLINPELPADPLRG